MDPDTEQPDKCDGKGRGSEKKIAKLHDTSGRADRMSEYGERRTWEDVKWGARQGMLLVGLMFVPALLYTLLARITPIANFWLVLLGYLLFGAGGGALVGWMRPWISELRVARLTGALIGAIGFTVLICTPSRSHPYPGMKVAVGSAILGALTGALAATRTWQRNERRG